MDLDWLSKTLLAANASRIAKVHVSATCELAATQEDVFVRVEAAGGDAEPTLLHMTQATQQDGAWLEVPAPTAHTYQCTSSGASAARKKGSKKSKKNKKRRHRRNHHRHKERMGDLTCRNESGPDILLFNSKLSGSSACMVVVDKYLIAM